MTPWPELDQNTRDIWIPDLLPMFMEQSAFYQMVTYRYDLGALRTGKVIFTQRLRGPINKSTLDNRQLWLPQMYSDSRSIEITAARYGDKVMIHKYDDRITQWRQGNALGLKAIITEDLGPHMIMTLDSLARDAFLSGPFRSFAGDATGFANLAATDTFSIGPLFRGIQLRVRTDKELRGAQPVCITSPGAVYTVRGSANDTEWVERVKYANPGQLINYEVARYESVPVAEVSQCTLFNVGEIIHQTTITASIEIGDGAPDPETTKVDAVWKVGQEGATHYITGADASGFAVGDTVTLHRVRNASEDALHTGDGVQYDHAYNLDCRIVAIDGNNISFAEPVMADWYKVAISSGLFGYITLARPVHAAIFVLGPEGVVAGVIQPPQTYEPDSIDDTKSIWRASWDAYMKYQQFYTKRVFVHFFAAPIVDGLARVVTL